MIMLVHRWCATRLAYTQSMLAALGRRARLAPALARHASVQASILNRDMGVRVPSCPLPVLLPRSALSVALLAVH